MNNTQLAIIRKQLRIGTSTYGLLPIRFYFEHEGKIDHKIRIQFTVKQPENSVNDVYFYILKDDDFLEWVERLIPAQSNVITEDPKNALVHKKKITSFDSKLNIEQSGNLYFIFDNRHSTITKKDISLTIIEEWKNIESSINIVSTIPVEDESLKEAIEKMINESKESLKIISPYIDTLLINKLLSKQNEGVKIQIILTTENVEGISKDGINQVKKYFPNNHKIIANVHSRVIIKDSVEVLISSADLNQKSLQVQHNLGINLTETYVVKQVLNYFEKIWNVN